MSRQVRPSLSGIKTVSFSHLVRVNALLNAKLFWLAAVACILISTRNARAASNDDWTIGGSSEGSASASGAATVTVPAPTAGSAAPASTGSVVRHSTAAVPSNAPSTQPGTPATPTPTAPDAAEYEDTDPSALDVFRADLDPYGRWVDDSRYGRVWVPDAQVVGADFAPYVSNGHWALDVNNNWVWESSYPFGWVVFHYGRWVWIDSVGWSWVPGRRYAPAWVVWRVPTQEYAYVGWAPAPPTFVWFGTGLFWLSYYPPLPFVFCPSHYVFYPHFQPYLVHDHRFAATLVHHSVWYSTAPVYGRGYVSPPLDRARVPARAVPSQRVSANPRAAALARPSANPRLAGRAGISAGREMPQQARGGSLARPRDMARPGARPFGAYGTDARANRPASYSPRPVQSLGTTRGYTSPREGSQRPAYGATPSYRGTSPSYSPPSRSYSTPRYSAPSGSSYSSPRSFGSGSYSAPSRSYSAPSRSYSAPSRSYSAPSFSAPRSFGGGSVGGGFRGGGGGGFRGGGGRHR